MLNTPSHIIQASSLKSTQFKKMPFSVSILKSPEPTFELFARAIVSHEQRLHLQKMTQIIFGVTCYSQFICCSSDARSRIFTEVMQYLLHILNSNSPRSTSSHYVRAETTSDAATVDASLLPSFTDIKLIYKSRNAKCAPTNLNHYVSIS